MITVQVRTGSSKILCSAAGVGVDNFFAASAAEYPLLAHIVPWADTAFNRSQVSVLMEEIGRYEEDVSLNVNGDRFDWLREMCGMTSAEPHRMLWFVGD